MKLTVQISKTTQLELFASIARTLFLITGGVLFAAALGSYLSPDWIHSVQQETNSFLLLVYATLGGFAAPGPRYALYPVLARLAKLGLNPALIVALISGHVLIEPSTFLIEIGLFGLRFPLKRFAVSLVVAIAMGLLTMLISQALGWTIL